MGRIQGYEQMYLLHLIDQQFHHFERILCPYAFTLVESTT